MITKLLLLVLVCSPAIQAFPSTKDDRAAKEAKEAKERQEKECQKKLEWYRGVAKQTNEIFDKYHGEYEKYVKNNHENQEIESANVEFHKNVNKSLKRYKCDTKKLSNISDDSARLAFCKNELSWSKLADKNLTGMAVNLKKDVLGFLKTVGVPKDVIDSLDKTLSRIVNFLFIADMTKNLFKDVRSLYQECVKKTDEGVKLEEEKLNERGEVEHAQEIHEGEGISWAEGNDENDNEIQKELDELENDTDIKDAEHRADERLEEERHENEEERENEEHGIEEKPYEIEYHPVRI